MYHVQVTILTFSSVLSPKTIFAPLDYFPLKAVKVKSKAIPVQAWTRPLWLQEVEAPRISRQWVHKDSKVVNPMHQLPLCQE